MDDSTERETHVNKTSVGEPLSPPKSYEEAAFQQHPKLVTLMEDLAKQLAMCSIQAGNVGIHNIFENMIEKYAKKQVADNENALWKKVDWKKVD